jgi:predicted metal-dependent phosphoesterase TrpH
MNEAFQRYANRTHVPCVDLSFCDAIQMARRAGGVTSWAHPPVQALRQHLGTFVAAGLQGLEAYRPYLSGRDRKLIRKLAKRHGLFVTGGSDWHGWNDGAAGLFSVSRQEIGGFLEALC